MSYDSKKHHRRSMRLQGYDYAAAGAYVVTLVAHERAHVFGEVVDDVMVLNEMGRVAEGCWAAIPHHFAHVELDACIVMPNHVHGIVVLLNEGSRAAAEGIDGLSLGRSIAAPLPMPATNPSNARRINVGAGSLGAVVRSYKAAVTRQVNGLRGEAGGPLWQRNYHDRIIRDERELTLFRKYIEDNPMQWALDRENKP